jgi:hypothetical protein
MKLHLPGVGVILSQAGIPRWDREEGEPGVHLSQEGDDVRLTVMGWDFSGELTRRATEALTAAGLTVTTWDSLSLLVHRP